MQKANPKASRGFTLLELIIVIAILAILSVAVVLVINPAETLQRARDSQRLSDLSAIKSAIGLYMTDVTPVVLGLGGTCGTNVWVSEDSAANITDASVCGSTVAPTQVALGTVGLVDGTGWLPVAISGISSGSPLSNYPIDPINDATNGGSTLAGITETALMYIYNCDSTNNDFELNANLESNRYTTGTDNKESSDGGNNANVLEVGTDLLNCATY